MAAAPFIRTTIRSPFTNVDAGAITMFAVADTVNSVDAQSLLYFPSWGFTLMSLPTLAAIPRQHAARPHQQIHLRRAAKAHFVRSRSITPRRPPPTSQLQALHAEIGGYTLLSPFSCRFIVIHFCAGAVGCTDPNQRQCAGQLLQRRDELHAQIYCVGDSITIGIGATNMTSWPFQCYTNRPDLKWYNGGFRITIGTNGDGVGTSMYGNVSAYYQPIGCDAHQPGHF